MKYFNTGGEILLIDAEVCLFFEDNPDYSLKEIGDFFGVSKTTISRILKRNGYDTSRRHSVQNYKDAIIAYYFSRPMTLQEVADKFGFCLPSIIKLFKQENIMLYERYQIFSPELREDYFSEIDTPIKAYFLGLLFADGCIFENETSMRLTITLIHEDHYLLERLQSELQANNTLIYSERDNTMTLSVTSKDLCSNLLKQGMSLLKKDRKAPYHLKNELIPAFIRGYFDGDGCIYFRERNGVPEARTVISFCGPEQIVSFIKQAIRHYTGAADNIVALESGTYTVHWSAKDDVAAIAELMYTYGPDIAIKRKAEKFLKFISQYNS